MSEAASFESYPCAHKAATKAALEQPTIIFGVMPCFWKNSMMAIVLNPAAPKPERTTVTFFNGLISL